MQKIKQYFQVRAVRLGTVAVLVATFVGLPSLKYYTGTQAFAKLDVISMAASVFLAQEMPPPPPMDGGHMPPPPMDGGHMPPAGGGNFIPPFPAQNGGNFVPPSGGNFIPPFPAGGTSSTTNFGGKDPGSFRGNQAGCLAAGFKYEPTKQECFFGEGMQPQPQGNMQGQPAGQPTGQPNGSQPLPTNGQPSDMKTAEPPKFDYMNNTNLTAPIGAQDDLSIKDLKVSQGTNKVVVNVCNSASSKNRIPYYIVRAEFSNNPRIGGTIYVQNKPLNVGECADVEVNVGGLRDVRPGQPNNLDVRLRNDESKVLDMDRSNDGISMGGVCAHNGSFSECSTTSMQPAPMPTDMKNQPLDQKQPMPFGSADEKMKQEMNQPMQLHNQFGPMVQTGPMTMPTFGPQPQFGFHFGDQEFKSQYDFAADFGAQFNNEYKHFQGGFGDYNFGDGSQLQPLNAGDVSRDKEELSRQLQNQEQMTQEFARMAKRIDWFVQEIEQQKARVASDKERASKQGGDVSGFNASSQTYDTLLNLVKGQISELEVLKNLHASDLASIKASVSALSADSGAEAAAIARANISKLETYRTLRDAMDNRVSTLEQLRSAYDFLGEVGRLRGEYSRTGTTMSSEVVSGLSKFESMAQNLLAYREQAKSLYDKVKTDAGTIRTMTNPEEVNGAVQALVKRNQEINKMRQEFQRAMMEFNGNGPFDIMGRGWGALHSQKFAGEMKMELTSVSQDLEEAKKVIEVLKGLKIQDPKVQRAIQELSALAEEGVKVMSKMKAYLDSGKAGDQQGQMDQLWQMMDKIGQSADRSMQTLNVYFKSNPGAVDSLGANKDFILKFLSEQGREGGPRGPQADASQFQQFGLQSVDQNQFGKFEKFGQFDNVDQFNNARLQFATAYDGLVMQQGFDMDALVAQIRSEVIQEVTRKVTAEVMAEVSKHVGDDVAGKILNNVMNNIDKYGDRGGKLLENTSKVLDIVATVDLKEAQKDLIEAKPELADELTKVESLISETKSSAIAESAQAELGKVWNDMRVLIETGGDEKEFQNKIRETENILAKNDDALVFEEGVKFKDTGMGENWYDGYVAGARKDGIVSGFKDEKGNLTGEFGPAKNVTKGEALKMALEAAGEGKAIGAPRNESAKGQWYEGYVKQAENLGLDIAKESGWNEPATRGMVAVMMSEVFNLGGEGFKGDNSFPDIAAGDPHAGDYKAVKEFGIFTGDSGSGNLRPNDPIVRAEVAKVMNVAAANATDVSKSLQNFKLDVEAPEVKVPTPVGPPKTDALQRKIPFVDFLKAMIPLFW